jgi:hypothetical protein
MKKFTLMEKTIIIKDIKENGKTEDRPIVFKARDLMKNAINGYQEAAKGIQNILLAMKITNKIDESDKEVEFEDTEWDFFFKAVDATQWNPVIFGFEEFFMEVDRVNKAK